MSPSALALAMVVALSASMQPARADDLAAPTLTVSGEGVALRAPDMATITLGIVAQEDTARAALSTMNASAATILELLAAAGVEARDMQTSGLSLYPNRQDNKRLSSSQAGFESFIAQTGVTVRVRDLSRLGEILDTAVSDGANKFQGLSFGLQDPGPAQDEARVNAVKEAARKAALYAEAAGMTLGPVIRIDEPGATPRPQMARMEMAMADSAGVPMAEGELSLTARVSIVYALIPAS